MSQKKRSVLSSIWNMKCPSCREGNLFEKGTFSFEKPFDMPKRCSCCNQNYMPEPGFYYGAMFISYIFYAWFSLLLCLGLVFGLGWSINGAIALLIFLSIILFVWVFKMARSIWIHIAIKYNPRKVAK